MIGTLIVCLPSQFEGGSLVFHHDNKTVPINWAEDSATTIQWVAFYGDVDHEVKKVTSGNRITLTYNICFKHEYLAHPGSAPEFNQSVIEALLDPDFLPAGGNIGIACKYLYPATAHFKNEDHMVYTALDNAGLYLERKAVVLYSERLGDDGEGETVCRLCGVCGVYGCDDDGMYIGEDKIVLHPRCYNILVDATKNGTIQEVEEDYCGYIEEIVDVLPTMVYYSHWQNKIVTHAFESSGGLPHNREYSNSELAFLQDNLIKIEGVDCWIGFKQRCYAHYGDSDSSVDNPEEKEGTARFLYGNGSGSDVTFYRQWATIVTIPTLEERRKLYIGDKYHPSSVQEEGTR